MCFLFGVKADYTFTTPIGVTVGAACELHGDELHLVKYRAKAVKCPLKSVRTVLAVRPNDGVNRLAWEEHNPASWAADDAAQAGVDRYEWLEAARFANENKCVVVAMHAPHNEKRIFAIAYTAPKGLAPFPVYAPGEVQFGSHTVLADTTQA